ncbi:efflux transporter periplasmic adaptor subunit [Shewanella sp. Choline-02u-19]|jgi:membrane fusion protein (multidrug efflux system)|uniref:efflux RND transporter periplasmic adaptor subunit n=1 Tax=unclassified Shewanella TaxID=196818 RepID=UPI000C34E621|nr:MULTISPECIES: efflux RND transporter periplasmic adaptor subunit [unclassified Shewanella]PKG75265.1 efflux transporter periplasmic adaptor subunit [Shewanella sp. GutCb]PKH60365.1 efflux transporter periplasmic adaptor subunit [Shewanella sp. Bg11-22]PKI29124.1 efflux transporter periplasmic adaptor subunit [Shewanella sp. Choline-02u-19]
MKKWTLVMLIIAVLAFGSVIGFNLFVKGKIADAIANMPEPVAPVTAITVASNTWQSTINAIGFVEPNQGVTIANELAGVVSAIKFENGSRVETGQMLIELDSKVEKANLKSKQVQLPAAREDFKRLTKLYQQNSVSKQDLDNSESKYLALVADSEGLSATIGRREISAPFGGLVGIRNVNLGEYLQTGTKIVRLEDISTMKIRFTIPQTQLPHIATGQAVHVYVDAYPTEPFEGIISAIEPAVFYQSGLIQVQAQIPNTDSKLRSGMFAKVDILLPELVEQIVLPQTAISFTLYGNSVYVIEDKVEDGEQVKRVKQINVNVVERGIHNALVTGEIKPGDMIVTSGQVRLSNNSKISVSEDKALTPPATLPQL